ncbi:hypothetical protein ACK8HX_04465 [Oryzobacter sp. R7]|uniref:hypothetical protein n=1 Tax=Oryzobacter faecalis TaxID=3388656 RepID=UPI00398D1027
MDALQRSIDQNSVLWLLVAGVVGAGFKLLFDTYLAERLSRRATEAMAVRELSNPLLQATGRVGSRLSTYLTYGDWRWYSESAYFRTSLLYTVGVYLHWFDRVDTEAFLNASPRSSRARRLREPLYLTSKVLSGRDFVGPVPDGWPHGLPEILKFDQIAMGEAVASGGTEPLVLRYIDFVRGLDSDADLARWFAPLSSLMAVAEDDGDPRRDMARRRIRCFALALLALESHLGGEPLDRTVLGAHLEALDARTRAVMTQELRDHGVEV